MSQQIGKLALEVEGLFGRPVDIEWAVKGGQVFLLQARAVTGITELRTGEESAPSQTCATTASPQSEIRIQKSEISDVGSWEDRQVWTNMGVGDVVPDVMTPVTWSMIQRLVAQLGTSLFRLAGADVSRAQLAGSISGRLYFNVNTALAAAKPFGRTLRGFRRPEELLGGAYWDKTQEGLVELRDENLPELGFGWMKYLLSWPRIIHSLISHSPRRGDAWTARFKTDNDAESMSRI